MTWSEIGEWLKVAGATVALFGVPLTYRTYRRSVRPRRAEWLASVHEKFFETDRYARIRHVLDYREQPAMGELAAAVAAGEPHELADALWLDYDLKLIKDRDFVMAALGPEGFDGLELLLTEVKLQRAEPKADDRDDIRLRKP